MTESDFTIRTLQLGTITTARVIIARPLPVLLLGSLQHTLTRNRPRDRKTDGLRWMASAFEPSKAFKIVGANPPTVAVEA